MQSGAEKARSKAGKGFRIAGGFKSVDRLILCGANISVSVRIRITSLVVSSEEVTNETLSPIASWIMPVRSG